MKRIAKEKGKNAINTAWKSKPLHDQYPLQSQKADVDLHYIHQWLRSVGLKADTEGFILTAQDQTADTRCGFCNTNTETSEDLISGCTVRAQFEYTNRHNHVDNIYTGKSVTIMILKDPTNSISINR